MNLSHKLRIFLSLLIFYLGKNWYFNECLDPVTIREGLNTFRITIACLTNCYRQVSSTHWLLCTSPSSYRGVGEQDVYQGSACKTVPWNHPIRPSRYKCVDQNMRVSVCLSNFSVHAEEDGEKNILTLFTPLRLSLLMKTFKVLADQILCNVQWFSLFDHTLQPHRLHCAARYDYMNYKLKQVWKKAVVAYFKTIFQHMHRSTKKTHQ
jgi:hypothetical protein